MVSSYSPQVHDKYDIIFAGGGTAACVTAGRLAAADPALKILILEAGPHSKNLPHVNVPALFLQNIFPTSTTASFHVGNVSKDLGNRAPIVPTGRCVGGGSSINWLMYTRASASDYDEWKNEAGNEGWGAEDLLPLLKKSETYQVAPEKDTHGYEGPLKVSYAKETNFGDALLDSVSRYDAGRGIAEDTNDLHTVNKWSKWAKWIDEKTGRRSDVASHFVYSQEKSNPNLVVAAGCRAKRVIFDNGQAVGVEYAYGNVSSMIARASKMVVVSAGAMGSPAILERSGIGASEILKACDIEQIVDLPGVGAEYQDHILIGQVCVLDESAETIDFVHAVDEGRISAAMDEWKTSGTGLLSTSGIDVGCKMRPDEKDLEMLGPEFQKYWKETSEGKDDKAVVWFGASAGMPNSHEGLPAGIKLALFGQWLMYPLSRGHVHIKSSNVDDRLDFETGFLKHPLDVQVLRWAYKKGREQARRHPMYRGEIRATQPAFAAGSGAAVQDPPALPVDGNADASGVDIVYTEEDDRAIDAYLRGTAQTTWHSLGTCPMRPRTRGGVVDSALNVYGVKGLKVADMSIAPSNVGANTCSTAIAIGEKAAVIIAGELGIKNV